MSRYTEEKSQKMRCNEIGETSVIEALSFDKIFGSIPTANAQKINQSKWGLKNELSKWY